jgi:hypothetical protein
MEAASFEFKRPGALTRFQSFKNSPNWEELVSCAAYKSGIPEAHIGFAIMDGITIIRLRNEEDLEDLYKRLDPYLNTIKLVIQDLSAPECE